jgi:4-amino-4-deoxy-L-arabinose transferase-like glycosyltransferase
MREHAYRLVMHRHFPLACFLLFLLPRALILLIPLQPESDAGWYFDRARELAAGLGYQDGGVPTTFWPVGYPIFLAGFFILFGPHLLVAQLVNLALSCGIFVLVLHLARRIFACEPGARIAGLLLAVYPNQIGYTGVLFSEMLVTCLMLAVIALMLRADGAGRFLLVGLLMGAASMVKVQQLLLPGLLMLIWLAARWGQPALLRRGALFAACFAAGMAVVVLPWVARNVAVFGEPVLFTGGGGSFYEGANPDADGGRNAQVSARLTREVGFTIADQVAAERRAWAAALAWVRENPGRWLMLAPGKAWHLWKLDGEAEWWFQLGYPGYERHVLVFRAARIVNQAFYAGILALSALALIAILRERPLAAPWRLVGYGVALYITAICMVFTGQPRYHFPAMPLLIVTAGWYLARFLPRPRD